MSKILFLGLFIFSIAASAQTTFFDNSDVDKITGNQCQILFPGRIDNFSRYCNNSFAVLQSALIVNNKCFSTIEKAIEYSRSIKACEYKGKIKRGDCAILTPGDVSSEGLSCKTQYAVLLRGHFVNPQSGCFETIDEALNYMQSAEFCKQLSTKVFPPAQHSTASSL